MSEPKYMYGENVRVIADGVHARHARIMIGDQVIPVISADIHLGTGELTTITLTARASQIDVAALQETTRIEVVQPEVSNE